MPTAEERCTLVPLRRCSAEYRNTLSTKDPATVLEVYMVVICHLPHVSIAKSSSSSMAASKRAEVVD